MTTPKDEFPPATVHQIAEQITTTTPEPYFANYSEGTTIAIDLGSKNLRAGLVTENLPFLNFPTIVSRYRERKIAKTLTYVGNDCYLDPALRSSIKSPFDGSLVTNWDYVEWMLDYTFSHLLVTSSDYSIDNPVIINETLASPLGQRSKMSELLFEAYNIPKVTFGISDLFSYYYNSQDSKRIKNENNHGIVIGCGNESTNIIPIVDSKPLLKFAKRIDYGGAAAVQYLERLLNLKYPFFPSKLTHYQYEQMMENYCYMSHEFDTYEEELDKYMDLAYLNKHDVIVEAPFTEYVVPEKLEEEIAKQMEKKRLQGKRLQEQAQKLRLEKLVQKEEDFKYFSDIKERILSGKMSKKAILQLLQQASFEDEQDFNKYMYNLERSLKRARRQDVGDLDANEAEPPSWPLLDLNDDELTDEQLKERKQQKLQKANYEARQKANEEKKLEKLKKEELEKQEAEWRERDLWGWIEDKRGKLKVIIDRKKQRKKLKDQLNDRKSHAAQIRMKNIANLASDRNDDKSFSSTHEGNGSSRLKRGLKKVTIDNDPNDTFGANDDDWLIYRDISKFEDEDELELEDNELRHLEELLLKYDEDFSLDDMYNSEYNWKKSTIHKFLRGTYKYDPEDQHQHHQMHLNVERIKIPEILMQPSIAGLDQAGVTEICESLLLKRLPGSNFGKDKPETGLVSNIFLTGGFSKIPGFADRIVKEFTSFLPVGSELNVISAENAFLDSWKGMKLWSNTEECKNSYITKQEYEEMGVEYIKEHNLGNINFK